MELFTGSIAERRGNTEDSNGNADAEADFDTGPYRYTENNAKGYIDSGADAAGQNTGYTFKTDNNVRDKAC